MYSTFLVAHVNSAGTGVGQREIEAETETEAREQFEKLMPDRQIIRVALKES